MTGGPFVCPNLHLAPGGIIDLAYIDTCEKVFRDGFSPQVLIAGRRFTANMRDMADGRPARFWHAVSEGREEEERTIALPRCEHLPWIRAIMEGAARGVCPIWHGEEGKVAASTPDFDYLVVSREIQIRERDERILLFITAFPIEHAHRRDKHRKQHADRPWP